MLHYLAFGMKNRMVDMLPWQKQITDSQIYNSVRSTLMV